MRAFLFLVVFEVLFLACAPMPRQSAEKVLRTLHLQKRSPKLISQPSTTNGPITTYQPSTTNGPITTYQPSTTNGPITTSQLSTTNGPITASQPSTTNGPITTFQPLNSTTNGPITTFQPLNSTTNGPITTSQPSTLTPADEACLKAHNDRRALHEEEPLTWNSALAAHAQVWADHLAATGKFEHDPNRNGEGENLAFAGGNSDYSCVDAMVGWYDKEEPLYDYCQPGFDPKTGHFTQVVWAATTQVGVAKAVVGSGNSALVYIVARYTPHGNFKGMFQENVARKQ